MNYTPPISKTPLSSIESQFNSGFRWNMFGSIIYEIFKAIHCSLLWKLIDPISYGKIGSIFSIMYLAIRLADFGLTYSLPPFISECTKSRKRFFNFIVYYSLLPYAIPVLCVAIGTTLWYEAHFSPPYTFILPLLIILETVRSFLRMFLHIVFKSKITVILELIIFFLYISYIWVLHLFFAYPLTLNLVFLPHLADSIISLFCFFVLIYYFYLSLPVDSCQDEPLFSPTLKRRLFSARSFNYLLRINRNMFTSNLLTPLFALVYNLEAAGVFYFASSLANAVNALIRSIVTFAGGGLFAHLKTGTLREKQKAFALLFQRITVITLTLLYSLALAYPYLLARGAQDNSFTEALSYSFLYLLITVTEFFFLLYEQFYVLEEKTARLFIFKLFELALFYGIIVLKLGNIMSLSTTLTTIIFVRIIALIVIGIDAYTLWHLVPPTLVVSRYHYIYATISLLIVFILRQVFSAYGQG